MASTQTILATAIITEGILLIVSYIVAGLFEAHLVWGVSGETTLIGVGAALPLLFGNDLLWRWSSKHPYSVYARFSREVIVPLCRNVSVSVACVLALLSGFCEEIFFRGVLNQAITLRLGLVSAAILSSFLFAYIHFIGQVRRFGGMLPLYTAIGVYLWCINALTGSLWSVALTHVVYNFVAIVWIRWRADTMRRKQREESIEEDSLPVIEYRRQNGR
jgi:membrane protease YdiL (CAAX protease family)